MELTLKERQKLTRITAKQYRKARKREKSQILDTFVTQTGYGRKYAIHILANEGKRTPVAKRLLKVSHKSGRKRTYPRVYDEAVCKALIPVWRAFNFQCGKLLAPFLHANIDEIAQDPIFTMSTEVHNKLRRISAATIDRLLRKEKASLRLKGTCGTSPGPKHLKALIPTLSHFDCLQQGPGLWQIDLVQHDGGNPSGEFCFTLTITEVKNAWTVHYALKNKAFRWVFEALQDACSRLPLPVRILHTDNGSEFINRALYEWCAQNNIGLTRSRGKRKNDNCFVEQKNGASVRKIVGYARYSGDEGVAALQAVYSHYNTLLNFFYPCQKLILKERVGSKTTKKYDKPQSPYERALADPEVSQALKQRLSSLKKELKLIIEMKSMTQALDKLLTSAVPVPMFFAKQGGKPLRIKPYG